MTGLADVLVGGARRFPRPMAVVVTIALVASAGGAAWWLVNSRSNAATSPGNTSSGLASVVRTDLVTTQQVSGSIGYGAGTTLSAPGGANAQSLSQAQAAADAAAQKLAADQIAAADQASVNQQAIAQAQAQLKADQATLASDQQKLQADQGKQRSDCAGSGATSAACAADQQAAAQDQQKVAADEARVAADQASVGGAQAQAQQRADQASSQVTADQVASRSAGTALQQAVDGRVITGLPAVGQVIFQGQAIYSVDGHPVPLFYGPVGMYRELAPGFAGPDVQELEQNLIQLGFANSSDLATDGNFTAADAGAIKRWQASIGVPQTGTVWPGNIAFLAGPVRVTAVHPAAGAPIQGGQPILDVTPTTRVVTVQLNPSLAYSVKQGDQVTIDLPDGKTRIPGAIASVSTVAQQAQGSSGQTQNGAPQTTIPVTIAPTDAAKMPNLDSAPVTVDVTTQSARNVLAVPVNALLALEGGGYAVEVPSVDGHGTHLVTVRTGIFDNSLVEVSGAGLWAGMSVVVPR